MKNKKWTHLISLTLLLFGSNVLSAEKGKTVESTQDVQNPMFAYTHLLPSPYTLPGGRLILGTSFAYGLTDFLQVSSNVLRDFYKIWNASAKVHILDFDQFALALTLGWESFNYQDISPKNPDLRISSWQPGVTTGIGVLPTVAWFMGGHMSLTSITEKTDGVQTSGYVQGSLVESDLSWAYNPKKRGVGNVLSVGGTFDTTYGIFGIGASHHWPGFQLGIHYYPNADQYKVQPILSGGAIVDL